MQTIIADIAYLGERFDVPVTYITTDKNVVALEEATETLYLTDDSQTLRRMLTEGYYIIALLHDFNERADLQAALYAFSEIREIDFDAFLKAYQRLAGLPWHIMDTARLTIRETTVADVDEFYRIYSDPEIARHIEPLFLDIAEEKAYTADYISKIYRFYGYGVWTVALRETGEVIGRAGISWRQGYSDPELGFVIARAHQRQGYAEEALRAIIAYARQELGLGCLQVLTEPVNTASRALCEKLGFRERETVMLGGKEHVRMVLLHIVSTYDIMTTNDGK
jgi:RimJ/RimL family protein N-acetyltransferase